MGNIELYDATLRDGMGGGGMSLTAEEKLRVVHALDALGWHRMERAFPSSNPRNWERSGCWRRSRSRSLRSSRSG